MWKPAITKGHQPACYNLQSTHVKNQWKKVKHVNVWKTRAFGKSWNVRKLAEGGPRDFQWVTHTSNPTKSQPDLGLKMCRLPEVCTQWIVSFIFWLVKSLKQKTLWTNQLLLYTHLHLSHQPGHEIYDTNPKNENWCECFFFLKKYPSKVPISIAHVPTFTIKFEPNLDIQHMDPMRQKKNKQVWCLPWHWEFYFYPSIWFN